MRVLVVSCTPWRKDNNIGNTFTNIFRGMDNIEIAHICCGSGRPDTDFVRYHLHIGEKDILRNLVNPKHRCCRTYIYPECMEENNASKGKSRSLVFDFMRIHRFQIFFFIRDLIWNFKNWICDDLKGFVEDFRPDIIFGMFLDRSCLNEMLFFLKSYTGAPLVVYAWDDVYTLRQFSLSPYFWINRLIQRRKLRRISGLSSLMYVISEKQREEYSGMLGRECKILYKGFEFDRQPSYEVKNRPLKLVYSGNIGTGRYKTLSLIGSALHVINKENVKAVLYIYTATPIGRRIRRSLNFPESIRLMGYASSEDIAVIQREADILVHAESFDLRDRLRVRQSFSTKLVDYFNCGRCIFAAGSKDVASIDYLMRNHAAVIAYKKSGIAYKLGCLISSPQLIKKYAGRSWECGTNNHRIRVIQSNLQKDLDFIVRKIP